MISNSCPIVQRCPIDPLSDVLSLLDSRSVLSAGLTVGAPWAMAFPAYDGMKFGAVLMGGCWLVSDGAPGPVRLQAGDCYLLTDGRPYVMASDLDLAPVDAHEIYRDAIDGVAHYGGVVDFIVRAGRTLYDPAHARLLLDVLPPLIHVPYAAAEAEAETLSWLMQRLSRESAGDRPGAAAMNGHLISLMFIQVLRAWLASGQGPTSGWLAALHDKRIAGAVRLMHAEPARGWTVEALARQCGMSRSSFSGRFRDLVGRPPLDYLLHWRMQLAARDLKRGRDSLFSIAQRIGYESESAFSNAFKRVMGLSPGRYRQETVQ